MNNKEQSVNIAIVASCGIGDGLLLMIMANNLQRNGYTVTFYSNPISQLKDWVSGFTIQPWPEKKDLNKNFSKFDLIIADETSAITDTDLNGQDDEWMQKCVFLMLIFNKVRRDSKFNYKQYLYDTVKDKHKLQKLLQLVKVNGCAATPLATNTSVVENTTKLCQEVLQLTDVVSDNGLLPLKSLSYRKHNNRVIIHPMGNNLRARWCPQQFVKLASLLQKQGWQPVFCVSPTERPEWQARINDKFLLPEFASVSDLAAFIYESGFMIGNDSGTGHLASCLKIPTLSIWRKKDVRLRPGWFIGGVVLPYRFPVRYHKLWPYSVPVRKVLKGFKTLVDHCAFL